MIRNRFVPETMNTAIYDIAFFKDRADGQQTFESVHIILVEKESYNKK